MAQKLFGDKGAVGQQILMGSKNQVGEPIDIVGVVGDVRSLKIDTPNDSEVYRPGRSITRPLCSSPSEVRSGRTKLCGLFG